METIFETFMLPSKGKIYGEEINPVIELTSMKVWQEMKRTSPTDMPYKLMSSIIEECMKEKPKVSVYDMCLGDYQYLLYKLRTITYGSEYKMSMICPECGKVSEAVVNLDDIEVLDYDEDWDALKTVELPVSGKTIELNYQTPRMLDRIDMEAKKMAQKLKVNTDFSLLFTLMFAIKKIDGQEVNILQVEKFCKEMNMKDANILIHHLDVFNEKIGMDNFVMAHCSKCNNDVSVPFCIAREFFGPTI